MKISPNEISDVEIMGTMSGHDVKLVTLKGGLCLAISTDGNGSETVLNAGSHPAIVRYNTEKAFPSFHPSMMKSEKLSLDTADKHSHFLSDDLRKSGHDIYSVQNGPSIDFYLTKHDLKLAKAHAEISGDTLLLKSVDKDFCANESVAAAVSEKALTLGIKKVKIG